MYTFFIGGVKMYHKIQNKKIEGELIDVGFRFCYNIQVKSQKSLFNKTSA